MIRIGIFWAYVSSIEMVGVCTDVIDWRGFSRKFVEASRFEAKREEVFFRVYVRNFPICKLHG